MLTPDGWVTWAQRRPGVPDKRSHVTIPVCHGKTKLAPMPTAKNGDAGNNKTLNGEPSRLPKSRRSGLPTLTMLFAKPRLWWRVAEPTRLKRTLADRPRTVHFETGGWYGLLRAKRVPETVSLTPLTTPTLIPIVFAGFADHAISCGITKNPKAGM